MKVSMNDEILLGFLNVLEALLVGYRECAQKIYAAEYVLSDEKGSETAAKMYGSYIQTRARVMGGQPGLGLETERWNESGERVQQSLAELRKKVFQSQSEKK